METGIYDGCVIGRSTWSMTRSKIWTYVYTFWIIPVFDSSQEPEGNVRGQYRAQCGDEFQIAMRKASKTVSNFLCYRDTR